MTKKRFINDIDNGKLIDTKGELFTIDCSDAVDFYELWEFLNKLNDENEQLKKRVEYLERKIQRERNATTKQHLKWSDEAETKIKELEEENEQLKQQMQTILKLTKKIEDCTYDIKLIGDVE